MFHLDSWPLALVFVFFVAVAVIAVEIGFRIGRLLRREDGLKNYPIESSASGIVLGLLAFILAFSFNTASNRFADMREVARKDTEAIKEAYVMAEFLPDDQRHRARKLLTEYHEVRLAAIDSKDMKSVDSAITRSKEVHRELWKIVVDVRKSTESSILNQVVTAFRSMEKSHSQRVNRALVKRLPPALWWTIVSLLMLSALLLGLSSGLHGKRSRFASLVVIVCFSAVFTLIVDLDRPFRTFFSSVTSPADRALLEEMKAAESTNQ